MNQLYHFNGMLNNSCSKNHKNLVLNNNLLYFYFNLLSNKPFYCSILFYFIPCHVLSVMMFKCTLMMEQINLLKSKSINIIMWMWSGTHGSTHNSGARGPGFDPTPKPRTAFVGSSHLPSFIHQT